MSTEESSIELADRYRQALKPTDPIINQQALWFEAGRASVHQARGSGWVLRAYSGVMTATAASLALALALPDTETPDSAPSPTQIVEASAEPAESPVQAVAAMPTESPRLWSALLPSRPIDPDSYVARRARALGGDLDAISRRSLVTWEPTSESPVEPNPPATRKRLLREYLPDLPRIKPTRPSDGATQHQRVLIDKELA